MRPSLRPDRRQSNTLQKTTVRSFISYLSGSLQRKAISTILALYCGQMINEAVIELSASAGYGCMLGAQRDFFWFLIYCVFKGTKADKRRHAAACTKEGGWIER